MPKISNKHELLAPAGNPEKLKLALDFGADAVYLGPAAFSLRVRVNDFDTARIRKAVEYVHKKDKKAYVTLNIFAFNHHLEKLSRFVEKLKTIKPDALIVSDPGVIEIIKEVWPEAEIHLSTQANCLNWRAADFWRRAGVSRIILGREACLNDISEIKKRVPDLELEYFVHGSMCMAYSGRCFLSKYFLDRSANLGDCVQPCRWSYQLKRAELRETEKKEELILEEDSEGSYILNAKDLCLLEHLAELKKAGVDSFKIEGRNKSVYYLACVVGAYRRALDILEKDPKGFKEEAGKISQDLEEKLFHRGYSTGFLLGQKGDQKLDSSEQRSGWEFCGQVVKKKGPNKNSGERCLLTVKIHNCIKKGDIVEIVQASYNIDRIKVQEFWNAETGEEMTEAHGGGSKNVILLPVDKGVDKGSVLRRLVS